MKEVLVSLPTVQQVQQFVNTLAPLQGDFELTSDQYVLDARSLMGIFGFDLTKPISLKIYNDNTANMEAIKPFIVDNGGNTNE